MTKAQSMDIPHVWQHAGVVIPRKQVGAASSVAGDPCIVWDDTLPGWRMVLFYEPPGHGQAICRTPEQVGPGHWEFLGPLRFANPEAILGGHTHKPFIIMTPDGGNRAARIDGRYGLVTVSTLAGHKVIQQAWSESLAGPWELEPDPLLSPGADGDFDAKHVDAVTAYYFSERREVLYFYMGYPRQAQARAISPHGSAQAAAVRRLGEARAQKLGIILPPCQVPGHWASGWVGGLQLLPGRTHRWLGLANASPTAPNPGDRADSREEPPPSLGGFAYCDADWPVSGWKWMSEPIERIEDVPAAARAWGEGTNLWRHHILQTASGSLALFYNSGYYGQEQLYLKQAVE